MCPACFASTALLITGVASTGGAAAITAQLLRKKKAPKFLSFPNKGKTRNEHVPSGACAGHK